MPPAGSLSSTPLDKASTTTRRNRWIHLSKVLATISVVTSVTIVAINAHASQSLSTVAGPGGGVPAPSASAVTPTCGLPDPATSLGPAPTLLPADPVTVVAGTFAVSGFYVTSQNIYVFNGTDIDIYTLSGTSVSSFQLPAAFTGNNLSADSGPFVDPSGNIWMGSYYGDEIAEFSPTGQVIWSSSGYPNSHIFAFTSPSGYTLGITQAGGSATQLLNDSGVDVGTFPIVLQGLVSQDPTGNLLVSSNGYVAAYNLSGNLLWEYGSSLTAGADSYSGAPYHFFYQGKALQPVAGGPVYTLDPLSKIEETSTEGYLEATTTLNGALDLSGGQAFLVNGTLYFQGGAPFSSDDNISSMSLSTLQQYLASSSPVSSLGWGAGITSGSPGARVTGNYFPYGTAPLFYASFEPWWSSDASHLQLSYSVWSDENVQQGTYPAPTTIDLPTSASDLADVTLNIPSVDNAPGPYQLQAELWDYSTSPPSLLGATCAPFSVGAPGDRLNFSTLPSGVGYGGPTDPRGVALNSQLGLNGFRGESFDWGNFLPDCTSTDPTLSTCGPSALTFSDAPQSYFQAAYLATQDGVRYWVQVSDGDAVSTALVQNGWWGEDVEAIVKYYSNISNCTIGQCAPVTAWEAWNEANNTYSSNGSAYEQQVLVPFYDAVKGAAPPDTVIGGSSLGVSIAWWQQVVAAGGLAYMDAAGVHPYTGNNDSWDEDGTVAAVQQLQAILGTTPIWFTEVGWWSTGPYNFVGQADSVATAMLWMKYLGIPVWNYFFDEGGWGNYGVSFSLIQASGSDDYVKPSALAVMEAAQQVQGRAYISSPSVGIPLTHEMLFGPSSSSGEDLATVWTEGLSTTAQVELTAPAGTINLTVTNQWGGTSSYELSSGQEYVLPISPEVTYLSYPAGAQLSVSAIEPYGTDLALGGTASASSSAPCCSASQAINGSLVGGWEPSGTDTNPTITVQLAAPATIDRVLVDNHSIGSTVGSPRDFDVSIELPDGSWEQVGSVTGEFYDHAVEVVFSPTEAQAVRISVEDANYGGYAGGGIPSFWPSSANLLMQVHAVEIYAASAASNPSPLSGTPPATTTTTSPAASTTTSPAASTTTSPAATTTTSPAATTTTSGPSPDPTAPITSPSEAIGSAGSSFGPAPAGATGTSPSSTSTASAAPVTAGPPPATLLLPNGPISGPSHDPATTPDGKGYWLVGAGGQVYTFGDAHFYGSMGGVGHKLPSKVVAP